MNLFVKYSALAFIFLFGASCSTIRSSSEIYNYKIVYSSGGGYTGSESGMTIGGSRYVKYWERTLMSSPRITDSTELTSMQLHTFTDLMKSKEIFIYKNDYKGNFTARLLFVKNGMNNTISFNPSGLPNDMPEVIKTILVEIQNIHRHP
ncbi:MAG: hypothetical protein EHM64_08680 [Ignavibacteriae bacterium]|nr:MAG: hypothetical protein EHM64_08680 [Ignavibacteriota bacterium]